MRLKGLIAVLSWSLTTVITTGSGKARAWEDDLYCSPPEVQPLESALSELPMCAPGPAHFVRARDVWADDCSPASGREDSAPAERAVAARALARARELSAQGRFDEALLHYRVLEAELPSLRDYARMFQAEALEKSGDPTRALAAYRDVAATTIQSDLIVRAQVGVVRGLIVTGAPTAQRELDLLVARYPELPEAPELRLLMAEQREQVGDLAAAAAGYRALDLSVPAHPAGVEARARLARLAGSVSIASYSPEELLTRAERLFRGGEREAARNALESVPSAELSKVAARRRDELEQRLRGRIAAEEPSTEERAQLEKALMAKLQNGKLRTLRPAQLLQLIDQAGRDQLAEPMGLLLGELLHKLTRVPAPQRFDALVSAVGVADDRQVLTLAKSLYNDYRVGVAARYHGARAHERLGERELALGELRTVLEEDRSPTRFYGNFAKQRIALITGALACDTPGLRSNCTAERIDTRLGELERTAEHDLEAAIGLLEPLARDFGGAYPWLGRALDWARLGEVSLAADELYETYLAFRTASRRGPIRAGRASVVKGASTLHHVADFPTLRARAQLPQSARLEIAEAARLLGDFGTTVVFGGPSLAETLPEAYASDVARVARKYGLDPDLLLAVMRVESVYQRRIISHAGAIGLMQIMPRTGRLIGVQQGRYVPATDLLDPHVNLELAGWYLRALIERMNGSLPLAIASYNGGPHNVRRWIEAYGAHLPLDAFLERIPFAETKRYVRRVLGYYARYRAERGEELDQMAFALPDDRPEIVSF